MSQWMLSPDINMKTCTECKTEKPFTDFHKRAASKDGYRGCCKICDKLRARRYYSENPEKLKASARKYGASYRRRLGMKTREQFHKDVAVNALGPKGRASKYQHKRRVIMQNMQMSELDEFVFEESLKLARLREETTCSKWHVDHIVPINHKKACGLHNAYNLQVVPQSFNVKKGNRNMDKFNYVAGY